MSGFKSRLVTFFAILLGLMVLSLLVAPASQARDWRVPSQAPTIQAAVDSAITGDVVVLAPGTYDDCTHLNGNNVAHIAILKNGVDLRGETGNPDHVILDANRQGRCLELRNFADPTTISGITFRRGKAINPFGSGGAVFGFDARPVFRDCVFDSCEAQFAGGGVNLAAGELTVENSVFVDCATDNIGAAIRVTGTPLTLTTTTIFRSRGPSLHYASAAPVVSQTIITGGDAQAVTRNNSSDPAPEISCTDIWGNDEDWTDFLAGMETSDGNLAVDPLFCNPLFDNLDLYSTSECAPAFNPDCGQIGARAVACGLGATTYVIRPDGSGDYTTIQAAINAAADADTIALADGTFTGFGNRDLDLLGKGVVVRGLNRDPERAIIDCGGSLSEPHRGFHVFRGENAFAVIRDLTITNADVGDEGAAMLIENSAPHLDNVVFLANHAERGAAVYVDGGDPVIRDCRIIANEGRAFAGGFAFHNSEAVIRDCLFRNNWGQRASAIFLPDSCTITISGTTFNANNSAGDRACIEAEGNSVLTLANCLVTNGNRSAVRCFDMAVVQANHTNVFNNAEGNWTDGLAGQAFASGNLEVDPRYCDPDNHDFTLRGDSECAAYNAANNLRIGALDVGCYATVPFSELSGSLPTSTERSTGVAWLDLNNDDRLDLHVVNPDAANEAFVGTGIGLFSHLGDAVAGYAGPSLSAAWADYDNDGDLDIYYSNQYLPNVLAANHEAQFTDLSLAAVADSGATSGSSWADYNRDGRLDLLVVRADTTCVLYEHGSGNGDFVDVTEGVNLDDEGQWVGSAWADYDNDGRRDLYLLNDGEENRLYRNLAGGFEAVGSAPTRDDGQARSAAWGDYDNDGKPDLLLVNDGSQNQLLRNAGSGSFTRVVSGPLQGSGPGRSGIWGDYDNDGDLDIFLTQCGDRDRLLRNDGVGKFVDLGALVFSAPDSSTGAAWGDFDNDGDLDLAVGDRFGGTRLYRNHDAGTNHWLKVRLIGHGPSAPVPGTRVKITLSEAPNQIREIGAGGGYYSTDEMVVHFGLGAATAIESLEVIWTTGQLQILTEVAADQLLEIVQATPTGVVEDDRPGSVPQLVTGLKGVFPNPFNPATQVRFDLAHDGQAQVRVYDVAGRLVRELLRQNLAAGSHRVVWNGRDGAERTVAAGVYFVRLQVDRQSWTQGVVLAK